MNTLNQTRDQQIVNINNLLGGLYVGQAIIYSHAGFTYKITRQYNHDLQVFYYLFRDNGIIEKKTFSRMNVEKFSPHAYNNGFRTTMNYKIIEVSHHLKNEGDDGHHVSAFSALVERISKIIRFMS